MKTITKFEKNNKFYVQVIMDDRTKITYGPMEPRYNVNHPDFPYSPEESADELIKHLQS